jgi:hypothetical protein
VGQTASVFYRPLVLLVIPLALAAVYLIGDGMTDTSW